MNVITVFVESEGMTEAEREALHAEIRAGVARFVSPKAPATVAAPQLPLPGVVGQGEGSGGPDDFRAQAWGIVGDGGPYPGDARALALMAAKLDHAMEILVLAHEAMNPPHTEIDPRLTVARFKESIPAVCAFLHAFDQWSGALASDTDANTSGDLLDRVMAAREGFVVPTGRP